MAHANGTTAKPAEQEFEEMVAELTQAAYAVALTHGFVGSFLNIQLNLWAAMRGVVEQRFPGRRIPAGTVAPLVLGELPAPAATHFGL